MFGLEVQSGVASSAGVKFGERDDYEGLSGGELVFEEVERWAGEGDAMFTGAEVKESIAEGEVEEFSLPALDAAFGSGGSFFGDFHGKQIGRGEWREGQQFGGVLRVIRLSIFGAV
jgi:hypothetical protein